MIKCVPFAGAAYSCLDKNKDYRTYIEINTPQNDIEPMDVYCLYSVNLAETTSSVGSSNSSLNLLILLNSLYNVRTSIVLILYNETDPPWSSSG